LTSMLGRLAFYIVKAKKDMDYIVGLDAFPGCDKIALQAVWDARNEEAMKVCRDIYG
jgi:hypothetical protein